MFARLRSGHGLLIAGGLLLASPSRAAFTDVNAGLTGVSNPAVAWGSFDGDSFMDLMVTGAIPGGYSAKVYVHPSGTFIDSGALPRLSDADKKKMSSLTP